MGQLLYGTSAAFEVDDRALAHLERVILAKLRRNESFALTLDEPTGGTSTVWLSSASTLHFRHSGATADINRAWLDALMDAANTTGGLRLTPEP